MAAFGTGAFGAGAFGVGSGQSGNTLVVVLPAMREDIEVYDPPTADLEVTLPALSAVTTARNEHNRVIVALPMPSVDVEADVAQVGDLSDTMPALSVEYDSAPMTIPTFDVVMELLDPSVWWSMDAADDTGVMSDGYWGSQYHQLRDRSGQGYDAAISGLDGSGQGSGQGSGHSYSASIIGRSRTIGYDTGIVTDSTESALACTPDNQVWALAENYDPAVTTVNPLAGLPASAYVLVDYEPPADQIYVYGYRTAFDRQNLWFLAKYYGAWYLVTWDGWSTVETRIADDVAGAQVADIAVVLEASRPGYLMVMAYINGVPAQYLPTPREVPATNWSAKDLDPASSIGVGITGGFTGKVQHAAYFAGRALSAGDVGALHTSAFVDRPKPVDLRVTLPSLRTDVEATVPNHLTLDVALPALVATAYTGEPGRSPMGGTSWQSAAVLVRGEITQASPREIYPQYDPSGLVWPYYSAWWKWTADVDTEVWFSTFRSIPVPGQALDTVLVAYTERAGNLTTVATSDDVGNWKASQVVISKPVIGQTYYIRCGAQDSYGAGIAYYVLDNDLCPRPTLADLIVSGGSRGPAGAGAAAGSTWPPGVPQIGSNSVSTPTHIPAGEQAWWAWTADYTGTVSFDTLLSQNWFTGGVGTNDPMVGLELWDASQFLAYSAANGTAEHVTHQGQLNFNVIAGHVYHIAVYPLPNFPDISAILRISAVAQTGIVVPPPKSIVVDITPQSRAAVASAFGKTADQLKYVSELGPNKIDSSTATLMASPSSKACSGFSGSYSIMRAFFGLSPQLDVTTALNCLWEHTRLGAKPPYSQWWGHSDDGAGSSGYWYGPSDPYNDHNSAGYGQPEPYPNGPNVESDVSNENNAAGFSYGAVDRGDGYQTAGISAQGSHWQVGISDLIKAIRARSDVSSAASLTGVSLMADEPDTNQQAIWDWCIHVTSPKGYLSGQWGPDYAGRWWSAGVSDAEPGNWILAQSGLLNGLSPMRGGGAPVWMPLSNDLLTQILSFEGNPNNSIDANHKGPGLTLAYLPRELALFEAPIKIWESWGHDVVDLREISYGCRILAKVDVQEPAYVTTGQPLGPSGNAFPAVMAYNPSMGGGGAGAFPPPLNPGPVNSQILFGPYPVRFTPVIDVLVFGPRHKSLVWPEIQASVAFDTELDSQVPTAPTDPLMKPQGTVRFEMPEFTLLEGIPVGSKAGGRFVISSTTGAPVLTSTLSATPHLVDLGEDRRFPPFLATAATRTISYRRHPGSPLVYRTAEEVKALPSFDGQVTLSPANPGPERVSSYAYWRGSPAATTAISFRPDVTGEQSLKASSHDWINGMAEITILLAVIMNNTSVQGPLSPLFVATDQFSGAPRAGLFFNSNSELLLWDDQHGVADLNKRIRGSLQLVDDIRRVSQPVLVGARINNLTGAVTLVGADSRIRTVASSLVVPLSGTDDLLIGDAAALTGPGAFDMLDMRWWKRPLSDAELLAAVAAMADLWGVLQ